MRLRIAVCAFTLLALAGFHLQPSLADSTPPRPQASYSAPVASSGPTAESGRAALVAAIRAAQAQQDADLAAFYTWASHLPAPHTIRHIDTPRPSISDMSYDAGSIEALICSVFGDHCAKAIAIARCESGLNPSAYNRSGASGLFQLLGHGDMFEAHGWSADDWADPYKNSVVAYDLSHGGTNWSAWVC